MSNDRIVRIEDQAKRLECMLPRILRRIFTLDLEHPATELPIAQLRVCSILQGGPRPLSSLSDELGISLSAVTQLADRLERSGFVQRVIEGEDRRVRILELTERGSVLMTLRRNSRLRRATEALEHLSPEDRELLMGILERLWEAAQEMTPYDQSSL